MALTLATELANYAAGIGTQGATLKIDSANKRVGVGTTNPQGPEGSLQVGTGITFFGNTGIVSAIGGKFSGDFTVGGTLTYEDVSNIDAVGIITAQSHVSIADSILHTGDTDTSIRFPAANTFTVETAGSERLRTDSSGRVIIGTNSGSANITLKLQGHSGDSTQDAKIRLCRGSSSPSDGNQLGAVFFSDSSESPSADIIAIRDGGTWSGSSKPGALKFATTADGAASATERVRITSAGLVGIGTDSPGSPLEVNGGSGFDVATFNSHHTDGPLINIQRSGTNIGFVGSGEHLHASTGSVDALAVRSQAEFTIATNGANERLRIDTSGRLLVAATSARTNFNDSSIETRLQIEAAGDNDSAALSIISNAGTTNSDKRSGLLVLGRTRGTSNGATTVVVADDQVGMIEFKGMDGTSFTTAASIKAQVDGSVGTDDMPGRLVFSTTADGAAVPTARFTIKADGKFGFNTVGPPRDYCFHSGQADTNIQITNNTPGVDDSAGSLIQQDGNDLYIWNKENSFMSLGTNAAQKLQITSGGNVNIGGNYTQTTYKMQVTGTFNATGNITQNGVHVATTSDSVTTGKAIAMAMVFG